MFSTAADFGQPYELHYVGEQPEVPTAQGVPLKAGVGWPALQPADLVLVPGWRPFPRGGRNWLGSGALDRLRQHHAAGGMVASVCAGADALGQAGLLDGRRCTTHHEL